MQAIYPMENAFMHKNLLFLINNQSLRDESILTYLKTLQFIPQDNTGRTVVVNGNELYFLNIVDNIFIFYSIDGKYKESTIPLLNTLIESIDLMIKSKCISSSLANFMSFKLCCYLPPDKKAPFGFVQHSSTNTDLFGNSLLQDNLVLYTKTFEFNDNYELQKLSFEHLVDYTDMIRKFIVPANNMIVSQPFFKKF